MQRRRVQWLLVGSATFVVALSVVVTVVARSYHDSPLLAGLDQVSSVLGALAGLLALLVAVLAPLAGGARQEVDMDVATQELGVAVLKRVRSSPLQVRLNRPRPLRVWFRSATEIGAARSAVFNIRGAGGVGWADQPLQGEVAQLAAQLRELPWRQLVVVGQQGAGKSVMAAMLVDQLLSQPLPGEPVPVLLGVSSWNPRMETVAAFVARRLAEDYRVDPAVASALVGSPQLDGGSVRWRILPVLDGLDEIPTADQPVAAIEEFVAAGRGVVVTCLESELQHMMTGTLAKAAVVRVQPLVSEDVIDFLEDPDPQRRQLWEPVFVRLREEPDGVLGSALSTPLMAGLAKDVYSPLRRDGALLPDPGELATFTSRKQIMSRLIDGFIEAVYDQPGVGRTANDADPSRSFCSTENATRWLGSLAYLGTLPGGRDLQWWRLPWEALALRPHRIGLWQTAGLAGIVAVVVTAAGVAWADPVHTAAVAAVIAATTALCQHGTFGWIFAHEYQMHRPAPGWLRVVLRTRTNSNGGWALHMVFGVLCGLATGVVMSQPLIGLVAGAAAAAVVVWIPPLTRRPTLAGPAATLRANHVLALILTARHLIVGAAACGAAGVLTGTSAGRWMAAGAMCFGLGALVGTERTWLRFRVTHLALSTRVAGSVLPRRLVAILIDGTRPERNAIRVNGAAWQFRHADIQGHLANTARIDLLARRIGAGAWSAAEPLIGLLRDQGDLEGAIAVARRWAETGDWSAADQFAWLLREQGDVDGAIAVLRGWVDGGNRFAALQLISLWWEQGNLADATTLARRRAYAGDSYAADQLAGLLREQEDLGH